MGHPAWQHFSHVVTHGFWENLSAISETPVGEDNWTLMPVSPELCPMHVFPLLILISIPLLVMNYNNSFSRLCVCPSSKSSNWRMVLKTPDITTICFICIIYIHIYSPDMKLIYCYNQPFWQTARKAKCENNSYLYSDKWKASLHNSPKAKYWWL
jgi:hypothetical protein